MMQAVRTLVERDVLVGVPQDTTGRSDGDGINNATLAYIHDSGSPGSNIPARPFMDPGIRHAQPQIVAALRRAATLTLEGKDGTPGLMQAGDVAAVGIRKAITNGDFVPLKPATIANRYRQRETATQRKDEVLYAKLLSDHMATGMSPDAAAGLAQSQANIHPLINTGGLLKSITYVIRRNKA